MSITVLDPDSQEDPFPPVGQALEEPDGLLAIGGNLSVELLLCAYRRGIFPWFSAGQPILWWSPDPRSVLFPDALHISRSLRRTLRRARFRCTLNRCFERVVAACAASRPGQQGTWITPEMASAYADLAAEGHAHSVEVWDDRELAGGLYGVAIGRVFFGESMFSRRTDASKVALVRLADALVSGGYRLIDCQLYSPHLASLGAQLIARTDFVAALRQWCNEEPEIALRARGETL